MRTPLEGFRIVELSRWPPGKWAGGLLADYGAEVISIDEPGYGERLVRGGELAADSASINQRNKRSMFLNLRQPAGRKAMLELAKTSDGFLESNRPGAVARLGVDYDAVRAVSPSIVYCSVSGFGQYGPYADLGAHDLSYQGIAGALPLDDGGNPHATAFAYADRNAAWSGAMAMLLGLIERLRSGEGQYIDVSFCDITVAIPPGGSTDIDGTFASYAVYETSDGEYLTLSILEITYWERLCHLIGRADWIPHRRPSDRGLREEQVAYLRAFFKRKSLSEWVEILRQHQILSGPVNRTVEQLRADPQLRAREMVLEVTNPLTGAMGFEPGFPFKFSRTPLSVRRGPTPTGSDTGDILRELGYSTDDIAALREAKVIA